MLSSSSSRGRGHGDEHDHLELSHHHHHHQDSLQIKQNDKFFSRLMSKETSMANSSSRVYYRTGASSSVPFMWESRPGTPKHTSSDTTLPPLTPPPSYLSGSSSKSKNINSSKNMINGTKFLTTINVFPRLVVMKKKKEEHVSPSSSWSSKLSSISSSSSSSTLSLSSSSSSCYSFSPCSKLHANNNNNNNVHYDDDDDGDQHACHQDHDHDHGHASSSTMCFRVKARSSNGSSSLGRYSMVKMKNALRSIVGHGSSGHQGTA